MQEFKYQGSVLTEGGRSDIEIRTWIGLATKAFQMLSNVARKKTKKNVRNKDKSARLLCDISALILISPSMKKKKLEAAEM